MRSENPNRDIEAKKSSSLIPANQISKHSELFGAEQVESLLIQSSNVRQSNKTLTIRVNATTVNKNKNIEKNFGQVEYYSYYKNGHYTKKYFNR